jgi:uncharacterized protein YnzC (UPF0291/DUF896 family)
MTDTAVNAYPRLHQLPATFPIEGAVRIEIEEGVPVFRASTLVQERIELLLNKQQAGTLTEEEAEEVDRYEEIDDYLSFLNRLVRNQLQSPQVQAE